MKSRNFLLGFFVLSIIASSAILSVNAVTYSIGVKTGDSFTYEIKTLDPDYPAPSTLKKGDQSKVSITNVVESSSGWTISYAYWNWGIDFSDSGASYTQFVPKDPTDWSIGHVCGTPVNEYLTEAIGEIHVSGNKIITAWGVYKWEITFDTSSGILSSNKFSKGDKVMFEYALVSIPGYELSILLGVSAVSMIGLIYILMKKKLK